jgi:hypothetical protein
MPLVSYVDDDRKFANSDDNGSGLTEVGSLQTFSNTDGQLAFGEIECGSHTMFQPGREGSSDELSVLVQLKSGAVGKCSEQASVN